MKKVIISGAYLPTRDCPESLKRLKNYLFKQSGFKKFLENFPSPYLEDSVLWYALDMGVEHYLNLTLHQRINFKQSYFDSNDIWESNMNQTL